MVLKSVSPPNNEDTIEGKWYAGISKDESGQPSLMIGKVIHRYLEDEDGKETGLELWCLNSQVCNKTVMEEHPIEKNGRPLIKVFRLEVVFEGPITVEPVVDRKWNIPNLIHIQNVYDKVLGFNRLDH